MVVRERFFFLFILDTAVNPSGTETCIRHGHTPPRLGRLPAMVTHLIRATSTADRLSKLPAHGQGPGQEPKDGTDPQ